MRLSVWRPVVIAAAGVVAGLGCMAGPAARPAASAPAITDPVAPDGPAAQAADADEPSTAPPSRPRLDVLVAEELAVLAPATVYYFLTTNLQREDFELEWDWPSWRTKLTSFDAVAFDTGNWTSNTFRHPLHGVLTYQAARANGYGAGVATLVDLASTLIWEYVVEYRERVSLNDLVVNNASGVAIGEPMWQFGALGDEPGASVLRRGLAWVLSPIQRLHAATGYRPWRRSPPGWTRLEIGLGGGAVDLGAGPRAEVRGALDVAVRRAPGLGQAGAGVSEVGLGAWSRVTLSTRVRLDSFRHWRFTALTSWGGTYHRALDDDGGGTDGWTLIATGFDYDTRALGPDGRDRLAVFHLIQPRLVGTRWHGPAHYLTGELGAGFDVGMIEAHVFGPVLPFPALPQTSVLRARGYYYGLGASLVGRVSWITPLATVDLEGTAYALTSIDGYDRLELDGAANDPHDVDDQRLWGRAAIGVPTRWLGHARFEVAIEAAWRRGAWQRRSRVTHTVDLGGGLVLPF